jgi:hypothetical protein
MPRAKEDKEEISKIVWGDESKEEIRKFVSSEKAKVLKMSEISILLNSYNDIFSSFDPRPTPQRALSDDFLIEAKKASQVKNSDEVELKLLMPVSQRNIAEENLIKKRLKDHFKKHAEQLDKEVKKIKRNSLLMIAAGVLVMFIATFLAAVQTPKIYYSLLLVIAEPAGWFLFWKGLEIYRDEVKELKPDSIFYNKMSESKIEFSSY